MSDEPEEQEESETTTWEDAATGAVDHALESADFDDVQGVIIVPAATLSDAILRSGSWAGCYPDAGRFSPDVRNGMVVDVN